MDFGDDFTRSADAVTVEQLRATGGLKWSMFPEHLGAFVAEMDFGTAPVVRQALHDAVDAEVFGYLPQRLAAEMGTAYAAWCAERYDWRIAPEDVRPLGDVVAGLQAAIEHFSAPGSPVVLPTPAYMPFLTVPLAMGREILQVPCVVENGRYALDLDGIDAAFAAGGGLLVLTNPFNPVGRVLTREELVAVSEVVDRHGGRVFSDEIHAPLVFGDHRHVPYASVSDVAAGHAVTSSSASKAWNLPGLKAAQLVLSNDADRETWSRVGVLAEHGASNLGVVANTAAFSRGGPWLAEVLEYLDGSRALLAGLLAEHLPEVGYVPPEGTYLAWLDVRPLELDQPGEFFREKAGVVLVDGTSCGAPGTGFVRLNLATPRPVLTEVVERMAHAVRSR